MQKFFCKAALAAIGTLGMLQTVSAQNARRTCASHEHYLQQMADNPEMVRERQRIEQFTEEYTKERAGNMKTTAVIYNIPVVVHVLYNTPAQNISNAQIQSQIDVLNKDFQKLNTDVGLVPSAFSSLVADCQVQFCLATRDPQGAPTTGIIRKSTTKTVFDVALNNAKSNSTGGSAAWPAGQYLNIWVVPAIKQGNKTGILGYAQFPGGPASTDGVVIGYKYFGTTGTAAAPFNLGRTTTHEVGHWLNLKHIWGDDGTSCSGSDAVGDTPNQAGERYGCPSFPQVSCSNGPNGDMFMNYMDYVNDACMYMFSNGQKTRMHAVLVAGGFRASLALSPGCNAGVAASPREGQAQSMAKLGAQVLNLFPNPATHEVYFDYAAVGAMTASVSFVDQSGRLVKHIPVLLEEGGNRIKLNVQDLPHGFYIVKLLTPEQTLTSKLMIGQ